MKRSTVTATCLVNSSMVTDMPTAEAAVEFHPREEFPGCSYEAAWNQEVDDHDGEQIIKNVGRAMTINVVRFINDLGEPRR